MPDHASRARTAAVADPANTGSATAPAQLSHGPVRRLAATAATLNARPALVAQRALADRMAAGAVVQRSVLSRYKGGTLVFYSDLEAGKSGTGVPTYATHDEAKVVDDRLVGNADVLAAALTTSEKPPRARRVPTPFGYSKPDGKATAKVRHQDQKPHSVAFASIEQRLQNRLRKNQQAELADQLPSAEEAKAGMIAEHGLADGSKQMTRYLTDLKSLTDEFHHRLANDADKGIGSAFHLVARKLLNIHPYAGYHSGKSARQAEDKDERFGSSVIDTTHKMKQGKEFEQFLQTRGDLYHSSDDEETGYDQSSKSTPYTFTKISPRNRKYARKKQDTSSSPSLVGSDGVSMVMDTTGTAAASESKKRKEREDGGEDTRRDDTAVTTSDGTTSADAINSAVTEPASKKYRKDDGTAILTFPSTEEGKAVDEEV